MVARCKAVNTAGNPCSGQPLLADGYCYWHSALTVEERAAARRRGGLNRSNKARAKKQLPAEPMTDAEVHAWLGIVFRSVIGGKMEPGVATAAASVAKAMVSVRQAGELERRLAELETHAAAAIGRRAG